MFDDGIDNLYGYAAANSWAREEAVRNRMLAASATSAAFSSGHNALRALADAEKCWQLMQPEFDLSEIVKKQVESASSISAGMTSQLAIEQIAKEIADQNRLISAFTQGVDSIKPSWMFDAEKSLSCTAERVAAMSADYMKYAESAAAASSSCLANIANGIAEHTRIFSSATQGVGASIESGFMSSSASAFAREIEKTYVAAAVATSSQEMLAKKFTDISDHLSSSYHFAVQASKANVASALNHNISGLARQYAAQFDALAIHMQDVAGRASTFDLSTTLAIAQFHGSEGVEKQLSALGLQPIGYDDVETSSREGSDVDHGRRKESIGYYVVPRLEDLRQILINLIASYLWVVICNPFMANPDMDSLNKRFSQLEGLIQQLPQLLAPLVEEAVRRELGTDRVTFVVRERTALLRTDPVAGAGVIATAFPNQVFTLLEERGKWIRVEFYDYLAQDVKHGWVLKKYCQRIHKISVAHE